MPRSLLFDIGGVLAGVHPERATRMLHRSAPGVSEEAWAGILFDPALLGAYECGAIGSRAFHRAVTLRAGRPVAYDAFREAWRGMLSPDRPMIDFLTGLAGRYRRVAVSNTNPLHAGVLFAGSGPDGGPGHGPDLSGAFDAVVLSHEAGVLKPDPAIFRLALAAARAEPAECLFVDDMAKNTAAAEALGVPSHRFEGSEGFFRFWEGLAGGGAGPRHSSRK